MTSIFGTFRRPKKKQSSAGIEDCSLPTRTSVFSSTPNLLKIERVAYQNVEKVVVVHGESGSAGGSGSDGGFERRRTSSIVMGGQKGQGSSKKEGSPSMRSFMSMMNVMGSLKRSKSIRKLGWGSSMNVAASTASSSSPLPPSPLSTAVGTTGPSFKFNGNRRGSSKSAEFLDDKDNNEDVVVYETKSLRKKKSKGGSSGWSYYSSSSASSSNKYKNTEPGVASSESSSENNSIQDTVSLGRASSDRYEELISGDEEEVAKDPGDIERKKNILLGTKKFNMEAKKGIEFLVEKGILQCTPEDVARFIKDGYGLSKASIGNYLGERLDFNEDVLKAFVELHDFKDLILVQALRQFLWAFRLPGESQKISRMLDAFAERYCQNNPDMFSGDTCSVLCYSIIMLNTELHNPNVKDKVTLDQFIKRNRGIEGGERFTHQFMASLYNSILYEPFRFPEEDGNDLMLTFFNPDYEGWLYKFGGRPKSWKRLWFILSNNCLYYFKFTTDKTPLGIIPLENILVRVPPEKPGSKQNVMILYKESLDPRITDDIKTCKTLPGGRTVPKLYSSIQLGTPDRKERERWVRAINANHSMSRFYSDLTLKKMKMKVQQERGGGGGGGGGVGGVRKSQISLPTTTIEGVDNANAASVPLEVVQDPSKDPNNFFKAKNLSAISLVGGGEGGIVKEEDSPRPRSRSESRLYYNQGIRRKDSLEVPTIRSRSNSKSPVLRLRHRIGQQHYNYNHNHPDSKEELPPPVPEDARVVAEKIRSEFFLPLPLPVAPPQPPQLLPSQSEPTIQLRRELTPTTAIYDKYKKLSMINELCGKRSDSVSSSSEEGGGISVPNFLPPPPPTDNHGLSIRISSTSSSSSSESSDDGAAEFEYHALTASTTDAPSFCDSTSNLLSDSLDNDNNDNDDVMISSRQIQIIDCSQPHVRGKQVSLICSGESSGGDSSGESCGGRIINNNNNNNEEEKKQEFVSNNNFSSQPDDSISSSESCYKNKRSIPEMCFESIYESNV